VVKALLALAVVLAGCQVDRRSGGFRCERTDDCTDGRTCEDGWCVGDDVPVDGPPGEVDAAGCPAVCSSCEGGTCTIDCGQAGVCSDVVVCPADMPCVVTCDGFDSCGGGVDCSAATRCTIACAATGTCEGPITCGAGACDVSCTGTSACGGGIDCDGACACDVDCGGTGACDLPASCPGPGACDTGDGCTSVGGPCDQCPS